jgi:heterodisulfide reductase subunit D
MAAKFPFAKYFGEINLLAALQVLPEEKQYSDSLPTAPEQKDLLLYLGCNVLRTAHLAKTAIDVLKAMGFDFNAVGGPAYCCGIVHYNNHEPKAAHNYARNSMRHFGVHGARQVIMWCPSCNAHYDDVVTKEQIVPFPYEHYTAFVARHLDRIPFVKRIEKRVALHYHTGHPQQDLDWAHARSILRAIPGIEYVEIPNPAALGRHCAPQYINRLGQAAWKDHVEGIMRAAADAEVDVLATLYHSCHREICQEEVNYPFSIVNYISLLGEAMGIQHPDVYKRYKLMANPEAVFEEVREYVAANGLDPERVRDVITRTFSAACESRLPGPS